MRKRLGMYGIILAGLFFFCLPPRQKTEAVNSHFTLDSKTEYTVREDGPVQILQEVKITNNTNFMIAPAYKITFTGPEDIYDVHAYNEQGPLKVTLDSADGTKTIRVDFNKKIAGIGKINKFNISYVSDSVAKKTGSIREINIPAISDLSMYRTYDVNVLVPGSFGDPVIVKPVKQYIKNTGTFFSFRKDEMSNSGVYILFGANQTYAFKLKYHIANSNLFPVTGEIALPPDTNYQQVLISSMNPKPVNVYEDTDGNWLAQYPMAANSEKNITVSGTVRVYPFPREVPLPDKSMYLMGQKYWETNDPDIQNLAEELKSPGKIYNYVVHTLGYDYSKALETENRMGARQTLLHPDKSVCLEFSDLFIALSRAAGIPAREVEGFAYSDNSALRPLSLLRDVLHAWPEYYDNDKKTWVMVDPTWGNTTNNLDYFNSLDTDHVAFAIKGVQSQYPFPAGEYKENPESKDVTVSLADAGTFSPGYSYALSTDISPDYLPGAPISFTISLFNNGNAEIKDKKITITSNLTKKTVLETGTIPPFGSKNFPVDLGGTSIFTHTDYSVTIEFQNSVYRKTILVSFSNQKLFYMGGGGFIAGSFLFFIARKSRRLFI